MSTSLSYVLQIFTGGFNEKHVKCSDIKRKLEPLLGRLNIEAVIIGWQIAPKLYQSVNSFTAEYNIPIYLWLPVFSEIGDIAESEPVELYSGERSTSANLNDGEGFDFLCPTSYKNIHNVEYVYNKYFSEVDFDGVFLDRIRYPSFSNGYENIYSCFCPRCTKLMERAGLPVEWYKTRITQSKMNNEHPFLSEYNGGLKNEFTDERWRQFFDFKHTNIANSIKILVEYFKDLNKKIGLDVFAPIIADFTGQDILRLSETADFIKPMMYYKTIAPAGINYERAILSSAFSRMEIDMPSMEYDNSYDIASLRELVKKSKCKIYPGFEVNHIKNIAETSVDYIKKQLMEYQEIEDVTSVVLSWNLLDMPKKHLDFILEYAKG